MSQTEILIINPNNKEIVLRDFYSSTISKGVYNWPNVDLLCLAGHLKEKFNVKIFDANSLRLTPEEVLKRTSFTKLKGVVFSVGKSVIEEDYKFIKEIKKLINPDAKILVVGGVIYYNAKEELKKNKFIDGCILNFVTDDILKYFQNNKKDLKNFIYRDGDEIIDTGLQLPANDFLIPTPPHEQLDFTKYQLSHGTSSRLTSVLTSYGCVHKCSFCVSGKINYRYRDVENIIEELKHINKLKVKNITFRDNIFGFHKKNFKKLLNRMIEENFNFKWVSDSRVDILDEEIINLMSKAGCHALHFGIESSNEETLNRYEKNLKNIDFVEKTLKLCKKYKIITVGYFILGLPGETEIDVENTIDYSIKLDLDFVSFNLPIPIVGTNLREESISNNWINDQDNIYDGSKTPIISTKELKPSELVRLRKKAYKKFYLRVNFVIKTLLRIRNLFQIKMIIIEFINLTFKRKNFD
mgnify:CR=1 FL=1|jgi:radical SAM superfamily enzyme YgiQ (UPF0313 family)